ncbi:hypothetical protein EBS43_05195 [bacterium]|nr:hypothetical protein [bacterium]
MKAIALGALIFLLISLTAMSLSSGVDSKNRLYKVLNFLESQPTGNKLISQAKRHWMIGGPAEWSSYIKWGAVSRTDTILMRKYNVANLTLGRYVTAAIEGEGGEVEAMVSECQVTLEINHSQSSGHFHRCKRYLDFKKNSVDQPKILQEFYHSGEWFEEVKGILGTEIQRFPYLSNAEPQFYSSIQGVPYPSALIQEYRQLTQSACENSVQRQKNTSKDLHHKILEESEKFENRCKKIATQ